MAHVNDVTINYGNSGDGRAYADIQFSVNFDQQELAQNIPFGMYLGLFAPEATGWNGWSGGRGNAPYSNQGQQHFASSLFGMGQPSNLVWSSRETITPNGYRQLALSRRVVLNQLQDLSQLPQLTAHIWMVPEHYEHRGMPHIGQYMRMNYPQQLQSFQRYFPAFYNAFQQPGMIGQNGFGEFYGPAYYGFGQYGQSSYGLAPYGQNSYGNGYGQQYLNGFGGQHSPNTMGVNGGYANGFNGGFGGAFNGPMPYGAPWSGNGWNGFGSWGNNGGWNTGGWNGFGSWNGSYGTGFGGFAPFGLNSHRAFGPRLTATEPMAY